MAKLHATAVSLKFNHWVITVGRQSPPAKLNRGAIIYIRNYTMLHRKGNHQVSDVVRECVFRCVTKLNGFNICLCTLHYKPGY